MLFRSLIFLLSQGPAPNLMTYQAYDINGYTFYMEEKDRNSEYQNSRVMMESLTSDVKERYYGRIEEIWSWTTLETRCRCFVSDGLRASVQKKKTDISPPCLYPKPPSLLLPRASSRKLNRGYWLAKLTNASSSPTRQCLAVLS